MQIELPSEILDAKVEEAHHAFYQKAAELFFKFSRFEHLLKKNGYLQSDEDEVNAMASLKQFFGKHTIVNKLSRMPDKKIVKSGAATWSGNTENYEPVKALSKVRNNLFHGEKNPVSDEDINLSPMPLPSLMSAMRNLNQKKLPENYL